MTLENNKDGAPEQQDNNQPNSNSIDAVTENFTNMAVLDDNENTSITMCANCGKGEEDEGNSLKFCGACKLVKYCSRQCQATHRPQHKKECKQRAAEIYDEKLFQDPPPPEECPICMLPLPLEVDEIQFQFCCGKIICHGCIHAMRDSAGTDVCAFCRTPPTSTDEEDINRIKKLMDKGNAEAFFMCGTHYARGSHGMIQNWAKAHELWLQAGKRGCTGGYYNLGISYENGWGVEIDMKKAKHYYELAVMSGHTKARHNLGCLEGKAGNEYQAYRHMILAAKAGLDESLDFVRQGFVHGEITKDEHANTLRLYRERQEAIRSDAREIAKAARGDEE